MAKRVPRKSALEKRAERFFSYQLPQSPIPESGYIDYTLTYLGQPVIVRTFTTYSACEDPIPDPRKLALSHA